VNPTPAPVASGNGAALYKSLGCSNKVCHGTNPAANTNRVLLGKSLASIRDAAVKFPNSMDFSGETDADLQAIADYLSTF
ncbi:MAG: cytochrome c, partial [Methylococcales bacterium]